MGKWVSGTSSILTAQACSATNAYSNPHSCFLGIETTPALLRNFANEKRKERSTAALFANKGRNQFLV
ncbi:MAG: hypothetical protein Q8M11_00395 [Sulfuritalea sp.]|nr:hypothetical protein [Sulfuritalea sp.]MDP1983738.1 hypothetical protein [Sulfuritalea sp.]